MDGHFLLDAMNRTNLTLTNADSMHDYHQKWIKGSSRTCLFASPIGNSNRHVS